MKDESQAAKWYEKAAALGDSEAKNMLEVLEATEIEES